MTSYPIYYAVMADSDRREVILLIFLSIIHVICAFNFIKDYYMQDVLGGSCNENINIEHNLFLRSHIGSFQLGNLIKYGNNQDCTITLDAGTGRRILLQFVSFDVQPKVGGQCVDYIEVVDSNADIYETSTLAPVVTTEATTTSGSITDTISTGTAATQDSTTQSSTTEDTSTDGTTSGATGSTVTDETEGTTQDTAVTSERPSVDLGHQILCEVSASPYESGGRNLTLKFVTDGSVTASGFKILVTSYKESSTCTSDGFKCDTNRCIPKTLTCDTVSHCLDHSDETKDLAGCTLLDDIIGTITSLGANVLIAIIVTAGVVILVPISSVIIYQCCCKKTDPPVDSETVPETKPKKLPKNVVNVEPVDTKKKGKTSKTTDKEEW